MFIGSPTISSLLHNNGYYRQTLVETFSEFPNKGRILQWKIPWKEYKTVRSCDKKKWSWESWSKDSSSYCACHFCLIMALCLYWNGISIGVTQDKSDTKPWILLKYLPRYLTFDENFQMIYFGNLYLKSHQKYKRFKLELYLLGKKAFIFLVPLEV